MRKPELLVPASSLEVLKIATVFGADAVYIGGAVSYTHLSQGCGSVGGVRKGFAPRYDSGIYYVCKQ